MSKSPDYSRDVKKIIMKRTSQKLVNFPSGYSVNLPLDIKLDFDYSPAFVRASNSGLDIKISKEYSPYTDYPMSLKTFIKQTIKHPTRYYKEISKYARVFLNKIDSHIQYPDNEMDMYFRDYLNRFIENSEYQKANSIKIVEDKWATISGYRTRIISFERAPLPTSTETQNQYMFAYMVTGKQEFYNFFFRTDSLKQNKTAIDNVLNSFTKIKPRGVNKFHLDLKPVLPKLNQETMDFYNRLKDTKDVIWGYFYPKAINDYSKVSLVEEKLDYKFPILLHYVNLGDPFEPFPTEGMKKAHERGQVIELTMQISYKGNDNSFKHNANFDVLDGKYDDQIHQFARDVKAFGHPVLFRLNNEMNTDWSQYSGVLLLSDADIYKKVWQRIYNIFLEEGVDNALWIFNPNDKNFPPANWNSDVTYYPGNEYVQLIGITGYNTGTYNKDLTGESWRTFDEIYGPMAEHYRPLYGRFSWIITEFASSSVGGDKRKWIEDMFKVLPKYPEIKAAVWWSYFDPDTRDGKTPARRYWLNEKDEYLEAFKAGLKKR